MASPADELAQAQADVERIARAYYETAGEVRRDRYGRDIGYPWLELEEHERELYRECTRRLLQGNVIHVGARPRVEQPMEGQTSIEDANG